VIKCKTWKAIGSDGITNELTKETIIHFSNMVDMDIHVICLELGHIPPGRRTGILTMLYEKKGLFSLLRCKQGHSICFYSF
jgi:hypothetical protein